MIKVKFPDGRVKEYADGSTSLDVAKDLSNSLASKVLAAKVNGQVWDATRPLTGNTELELLTWDDLEGKSTFWHSSAHLLAEALESIYPGTKFGIGPPIESGFYYDIDPTPNTLISADDFKKIEDKMLDLARQKNPYIRENVSKEEALKYFTEKDDPYKLELINDLADGTISFYKQGNFTDLCRGPHIPNTGFIKAVKLLNVAGAYWRGDEKNKQLTRIYAITFPDQKQLTDYLSFIEEAKKRDHRKLGKELELFTFSERVGLGLPLWLPKGAQIRERLERFMRNAQAELGYLPVVTPHIGHKDLYVTSGHYDKYGKDSFQPIRTPQEGEEFFLKPMNCPHHCEIYRSSQHSYKDLPIRLAEFGTVYRYEQSGELHGLTRVRGFTQDDAHIFCRPDQVKEEFITVINLVQKVLKTLDFKNYTAQISLRDKVNREKYIGSDENWEKAENAIIEAAAEKGLTTVTVYGEAAFYGPKLDFMVKDALNRSWQLGTVQVDYNLPERFKLEYVGSDNAKHCPVMIHRAPFGSLERFIAVLLEHCAGNLPLWLAPEQVAVLPIGENQVEYAKKVIQLLKKYDIRTLFDERGEKIGRKIREAEMKKIPYMLVIGDKEIQDNKVSVRKHGKGDIGVMETENFVAMVVEEVKQILN